MKSILFIAGLLILQGCSKTPQASEPKTEIPQADNAATHYVGSLQMDVKQAQSAVNRMNRGIEKSQNAVSQAEAQSE